MIRSNHNVNRFKKVFLLLFLAVFNINSIGNRSLFGFYKSLFSLNFVQEVLIVFLKHYLKFQLIRGSDKKEEKFKIYMPKDIKERFDSVAGAHDAKEALQDIVEFLKNPEVLSEIGANIPSGVLLYGAPGNGKTLLAKAIAGEADCPFLSISGSDFIERYVGVGSARIRSLFNKARELSPCIIFIDEIDAIGKQRKNDSNSGNDERDQTLNKLLAEVDGVSSFNDKKIIVLIAATNRFEVLDPALTRPGRFDQKIEVAQPDFNARLDILKINSRKIKLSKNIDWEKIALTTAGFSGAELACLVNNAAIIAVKKKKKLVEKEDVDEACERAILGPKLKNHNISKEELLKTAYHESGHALILLLMKEATRFNLNILSIESRANYSGIMHLFNKSEYLNYSREEMLAQITIGLGGRAAEELLFNEISSGTYSDLKQITAIARVMICEYGMSEELGKVVYNNFKYSEKTAEKIDFATKLVIDQAYEKAKSILMDNRDKLDKLALALFEKKKLYASEVYDLLELKSTTSG